MKTNFSCRDALPNGKISLPNSVELQKLTNIHKSINTNLKHQKRIIMKQLIFLTALCLIPFLMNAQGVPTTLGNPTTGVIGTSGGFTSTYVGTNAGIDISTNSNRWNTFVGSYAGYKSDNSATSNAFFGASTGYENTYGYYNTFIGQAAGRQNTSGSRNTILGRQAGYYNTSGSNNVIIGHRAGFRESGSNKLYIDSQEFPDKDPRPALIYGDFADEYVVIAGGHNAVDKPSLTDPSVYGLYVTKGILTERVKVASINSSDWADYVFEEDYDLNSVEKVEAFVKENKHLPNVPSAKEVSENGVDMVEMDATLLRQIEELWLHVIDLKKENDTLKEEVKTLSNK